MAHDRPPVSSSSGSSLSSGASGSGPGSPYLPGGAGLQTLSPETRTGHLPSSSTAGPSTRATHLLSPRPYAHSTPNLSFGESSALSIGPATPRSRTRTGRAGDVGEEGGLGMGMAPAAGRTEGVPDFLGRAGSTTPSSKAKGKARDYGDRFIPQRSATDMAATFQLLEPAGGGNGIHGSKDGGPDGTHGRRLGGNGEIDALKDEANRAFTHLLKTELFSPAATSSSTHPLANSSNSARPIPFHSASAPSLPVRSPSHTSVPVPHNHHPVGNGLGVSALPPIPSHVPATPATEGRAGAFDATRTASGRQAMSPGAAGGTTPTTPSRKRMFHFASAASGRSGTNSPGRKLIPSSPGNFTSQTLLAGGFGTGPGIGGHGLDDMLHEQYSLSPAGRESQRMMITPRKGVRWLSKTPFKVLDAPELADDFYLNLVSWSSTNVLGVGLSACVYLWSAHTSKVTKLCDLSPTTNGVEGGNEGDVATGLEWTNRGNTIAIGTNKGQVQIWDAEKCKKIRTMTGHTGRVGCLAWNEHILSTGSRDRSIFHRDVRIPQHHIRELKGHRQEVCGLRWNSQTDQLASGGNDNKLFVWDKTNEMPLYRFSEHSAAVKAIAWSPHHRGILASGGGTADKKIRFWNGLTGTMLSEWDTGAQVCNLMWSKNSNELVSTHGYSGGTISNQVCIWRYPTMTQVSTLTGHTFRVLYLAMSPDGQTIVTGAGDETLRFWNAFQKKRTHGEGVPGKESLMGTGMISLKKGEGGLDPFARIR